MSIGSSWQLNWSLNVFYTYKFCVYLLGLHPPGPPLARPILPRERGALDRIVEYLVGDGPQNR